MEDIWKGTETMEREGLDNMDWTEGHSDCRAGRKEKSKVEEGTYLKGWERVSATMFLEPGMWRISLVNLEM